MGHSLARKDNAPAKRIVRTIALADRDVMRGVGLLHQDREVHSRRPTTDDIDLHS